MSRDGARPQQGENVDCQCLRQVCRFFSFHALDTIFDLLCPSIYPSQDSNCGYVLTKHLTKIRDTEGWTIETNGLNAAPPTHDTASMGNLNDFIYSEDMEIETNRAGLDTILWQFVAPSKFHGDFAVVS